MQSETNFRKMARFILFLLLSAIPATLLVCWLLTPALYEDDISHLSLIGSLGPSSGISFSWADVSHVFNWHPILMVTSYTFVSANGILL
jgi:hypothetical protein